MKDSDLIFLDLDEDDLSICAGMFVEAFSQPPWDETWETDDAFDRISDFLACPRSIGIKAIQNNQVVGFLIGNSEVWSGGNYFYLKEMCISHRCQRSGVGSALMKKLEERLHKQKISRLYLMTQRDTIPERFYTSLGYMVNDEMIVMKRTVLE